MGKDNDYLLQELKFKKLYSGWSFWETEGRIIGIKFNCTNIYQIYNKDGTPKRNPNNTNPIIKHEGDLMMSLFTREQYEKELIKMNVRLEN